MRRSMILIVALLGLATLPVAVGAGATTTASACGPAPAEAPAEGTPTTDVTDSASAEAALDALRRLPLDRLPAAVGRGVDAETGALSLGLPAPLDALSMTATVTSDAAGPIGTVDIEGDELVFRFLSVNYDVEAIALPNGLTIEAQTITLDPSRPSLLCLNMTTGRIARDFHWLLHGVNVAYDGQDTLALGDTGASLIAGVDDRGGDRWAIRLITRWRSTFTLESWTIDDQTLPSGTIEARADFDGTYQIVFFP